ncbi:Ribosome-recycling factor [bacterium HR40]|nr:Ribosome-recycling factor [bacterium HR40]
MSGAKPDLKEFKKRMDGAVEVLRRELGALRAGRASAGILDPVQVEAYGTRMPIHQLGTIGVPEPRLLTVHVWDKSLVKAVEKAIRNADLGLNPQVEGDLIRIPLPELSEERRQELVRVAHKYAEQARVAVRNVRRDGMELLKRLDRDGQISQDEHRHLAEEIQKLTDQHIAEINKLLEQKEKDILGG